MKKLMSLLSKKPEVPATRLVAALSAYFLLFLNISFWRLCVHARGTVRPNRRVIYAFRTRAHIYAVVPVLQPVAAALYWQTAPYTAADYLRRSQLPDVSVRRVY